MPDDDDEVVREATALVQWAVKVLYHAKVYAFCRRQDTPLPSERHAAWKAQVDSIRNANALAQQVERERPLGRGEGRSVRKAGDLRIAMQLDVARVAFDAGGGAEAVIRACADCSLPLTDEEAARARAFRPSPKRATKKHAPPTARDAFPDFVWNVWGRSARTIFNIQAAIPDGTPSLVLRLMNNCDDDAIVPGTHPWLLLAATCEALALDFRWGASFLADCCARLGYAPRLFVDVKAAALQLAQALENSPEPPPEVTHAKAARSEAACQALGVQPPDWLRAASSSPEVASSSLRHGKAVLLSPLQGSGRRKRKGR